MALLLDTDLWTKDLKNNYTQYVMGTPTIEMYCMSYKDTHPEKYVECGSSNETGYYGVKWSNSSNSITMPLVGGTMTINDFDGIYVKNTAKNAYWLLGPIFFDGQSLMFVTKAGNFGYDYCSLTTYNAGVRPVVCLKDGIQLKKQANGNYRIIEE